MALHQNPFFIPVMESIDMIAGQNMQMQAEQRAEERQISGEERQAARQDELIDRNEKTKELGELTKYITNYEQQFGKGATATLKDGERVSGFISGAEPDPEMLKSVVERRNALIQEGIRPQMSATAPQAEKPDKTDMVLLSPATAQFYGYDPQQPVKRETKRILESNYRNYHKPPEQKGDGADKNSDPLTIIADMRKRSQAVFDKGVLEKGDDWRSGIGMSILSEYQSDLQQIEQDYRAGLLSKAEARMKAVQLGTFDQFLALHGADRDQTTKELSDIKETLLKMAED